MLKVDEAGKVTALKVGKATITATAVDVYKRQEISKQLGILPVRLIYKPDRMALKNYEINQDPQPTPEKNDGAVQTGDNVSPMLYAGAAMTAEMCIRDRG